MVRSYSSKELGNGVKERGLDQMKNNSGYRGSRPYAMFQEQDLTIYKMTGGIKKVNFTVKSILYEFFKVKQWKFVIGREI